MGSNACETEEEGDLCFDLCIDNSAWLLGILRSDLVNKVWGLSR